MLSEVKQLAILLRACEHACNYYKEFVFKGIARTALRGKLQKLKNFGSNDQITCTAVKKDISI